MTRTACDLRDAVAPTGSRLYRRLLIGDHTNLKEQKYMKQLTNIGAETALHSGPAATPFALNRATLSPPRARRCVIANYLVAVFVSAFIAFISGCATKPGSSGEITKQPFGATKDGTAVHLYTLRNANGVEAKICNYGGIVVSLRVPDRNGEMGDVVLGYDTLAEYIKETPYF